MIPEERRHRILALLRERNYMSVEELAQALYVSVPTVRRDLASLDEEGSVKRTHGGASFVNPESTMWPVEFRNKVNSEAKRAMGRLAAGLLSEGDHIFIDSGSTCLAVAEAIDPEMKLTVLTNGFTVAEALAKKSKCAIEFPCGQYDRRHAGIIGDEAAEFIRSRYAKYSFVSASGLDPVHGATNRTLVDRSVKKAYRSCSDKMVLLVDHTKIGEICYYPVFRPEEIDILITDKPLPEELAAACEDAGIRVMWNAEM